MLKMYDKTLNYRLITNIRPGLCNMVLLLTHIFIKKTLWNVVCPLHLFYEPGSKIQINMKDWRHQWGLGPGRWGEVL